MMYDAPLATPQLCMQCNCAVATYICLLHGAMELRVFTVVYGVHHVALIGGGLLLAMAETIVHWLCLPQRSAHVGSVGHLAWFSGVQALPGITCQYLEYNRPSPRT